jgi:predicted HAD superfamily Cof-like phosphohydrolase
MTIKKTNFQKVQEFTTGFDVVRTNTPDDKLFKLRWDLILEESDELFQALSNQNYVEILDAVSDILYVVLGAADSFNQDFDSILYDSMKDSDIILLNYKYTLKDEILLMPISEYRMKIIFDEEIEKLNILQNEYSTAIRNLKEAFVSKNIDNIMIKLIKVYNYLYVWAYLFGFDLDQTFALVHDSNMSKLAESEKIAQDTVEWYLKNESRYDSPSYRLSPVKVNGEDRWIIYNSSSGKVLKSINYYPVDLGKYLHHLN